VDVVAEQADVDVDQGVQVQVDLQVQVEADVVAELKWELVQLAVVEFVVWGAKVLLLKYLLLKILDVQLNKQV
jgi:hypothetical protein